MARLRKGDTVAVLNGKDRGKRGKILRVMPAEGAALVEQLNLATYFERRTRADQQSGMIRREAPMALDRLALICPRCSKPTRVRFVVEGSEKRRVCKQCRETIGG
jgi:large subunit ribosomal protein L24